MRIRFTGDFVQLGRQPGEYRLEAGRDRAHRRRRRLLQPVGDGSLFPDGELSDPHDPMLEGYTAQSYHGGDTKQIKHGMMVTGGFYRHPGILVKTVNDARCAFGRAGVLRHRRGLVRARGARSGRAVPADGRAF